MSSEKTKTSKAFKNARVKKQFASKVTPKCSLQSTINHNLRLKSQLRKPTDAVDTHYINFIFRKNFPYTFSPSKASRGIRIRPYLLPTL